MKALSRACPVGDPEYNRREVGRRERSAAGIGGGVNERGSMPTLLNDTNILARLTLVLK